ncbi:hypothetical protein [Nocardia sp. NPDC050412]|uniref:hypothetical protein n=1 Tax=Nocardia sp. NPDC050412 TaxID=3364320 RepID=UPI0037AD13DC
MVAFADNPLALPPSLDRLLRNQVDIGNAFAPYYGQEVGGQLTSLLTIHILQAVPVLTAARIGYQPALDRAVADWHGNARDIADFFASINPNWSQQDMREAMSMHIDQTVAYAAAVIGGKYSDATAKFDEAKAHIMDVADILSQGIITQFPDKFLNSRTGGRGLVLYAPALLGSQITVSDRLRLSSSSPIDLEVRVVVATSASKGVAGTGFRRRNGTVSWVRGLHYLRATPA